jgi:hypothetical protein
VILSLVRSAVFAAVTQVVGPGRLTTIERRLGGRKALSARTHIAHRAFRAHLFRRMKAAHDAARPSSASARMLPDVREGNAIVKWSIRRTRSSPLSKPFTSTAIPRSPTSSSR